MENTKQDFYEIILCWLNNEDNKIRYSTIVKYEQLIRNYMKPYFKGVFCQEITDVLIQDFYRSVNEPLSNSKLSEGNIRTIIMIVNNSFDYAYDNHLIDRRIHIKPSLSKSKPIVSVFTETEQAKMEEYIFLHHNKYSLALFLALYTGMRIGELCSLKWRDFDFEKGAVTISRTVQRLRRLSDKYTAKTELVISGPKSGASCRLIPLSDFVVEYVKSFCPEGKKEYFVLTDSETMPLDPRTLQYGYKRILKLNNISYLNFHCLRHTFATRCVTVGWDVKTLSEVLGHSDIRITLEYYFHSSFEYKKVQMNKLFLLSKN